VHDPEIDLRAFADNASLENARSINNDERKGDCPGAVPSEADIDLIYVEGP
jgi:hypothetical protein